MRLAKKVNSPIAPKLLTNLRYNVAGTLNGGAAGAAATVLYRANDCYDPEVASGGGQPRGFDQLMGLYDHGTVIGSKITIRAANTDATYAFLIGCAVMSGATALTAAVSDYMEQFSTRSIILSDSAGGQSVGIVSNSMSTKKYLSIGAVLSEKDLSFDNSSSPAEQIYYHLFISSVQPQDGSVVSFNVTIDYTVVFTEPRELAAS